MNERELKVYQQQLLKQAEETAKAKKASGIRDAQAGLEMVREGGGAEAIKDLENIDLSEWAGNQLIEAQAELGEFEAHERYQKKLAQAMHPEVDIDKLMDPKNISKTAEQQIARGLIYEGKVPEFVPPDRFKGRDFKDKTKLGIEGPFQPDSEVRGHTRLSTSQVPDGTGLDNTVYDISRDFNAEGRVYTEIPQDKFVNDLASKSDQSRNIFNATTSEYYGQQGLKLAGHSAPKNNQRSAAQQNSKNLSYKKERMVLDTDRLLEQGPKASSPEMAYEADLRSVDGNGKIRVGDYQTADPNETLRINMAKGVQGESPEMRLNPDKEIRKAINGRSGSGNLLDEAFDNLTTYGHMPEPKRFKTDINVDNPGYMPGKALANGPRIGTVNLPENDPFKVNVNIEGPDQREISYILYGKGDKGWRNSQGLKGIQPKSLEIVDTDKVREIALRRTMDAGFAGNNSDPIFKWMGNSLDAYVPEESLTKGTRASKPLLDSSTMSQISEPISPEFKRTPSVVRKAPQVKRTPDAPIRKVPRGGGAGGARNFATQALDVVGGIAKNPGVRMAGLALGAIPILGDAADATTGTIDVVTKKGDQQVRGAGNAVAGLTGLATLAAPAAAPILAPVSAGLGIGNALADNAKERKQERSIGESSKYERLGTFSHTEDNPVSIGLPGTVQSETQRRRQARRSSSGRTPSASPQTGKQWWEQGVESVMNYFQ